MKKQETNRLILRNFTLEDYPDLYEFLSQRKDDEFEGYPGITYENGVKHLKYRLDNDEFIAIELKENHKVIGNIYLGKRDFNSLELGYIVNKDYQLKGYATEAASFLIKEAFNSDVHKVFAECNPLNTCSFKFLESLGFVQEGHLRMNVSFKNDSEGKPIYQDTLIYGLLSPKD